MIVRMRFRRRFFSLLPFLSSFDRSPFGSSLFPSPLLRLVGAGASGRAASVGILQFSHTVCWTVCDYRTRTLSFFFLFRIFSSALVRAYFRCLRFSRAGSLGLFVGVRSFEEKNVLFKTIFMFSFFSKADQRSVWRPRNKEKTK